MSVIQPENLVGMGDGTARVVSMYVDQTPRPLLSVDEAVRRYREAVLEVKAAIEAHRVAWEASHNTERRANVAQTASFAALEDLRRAITEAPE